MRKLLQGVVVGVIAILAVTGWRWYSWATNTQDPYDEVGITLNSYMPAPLQDYACGKLHATFAGALPPLSCGDATGHNWRR